MTSFYHCACVNVILLGRVAKPFQHQSPNNIQQYPKFFTKVKRCPKSSNNIQHHSTTPNMGGKTSATFVPNIGICWAKMLGWFGQGLRNYGVISCPHFINSATFSILVKSNLMGGIDDSGLVWDSDKQIQAVFKDYSRTNKNIFKKL